MSVDPLAEKYYSWSPYVYCLNNPIMNIDINGDSVTHVGAAADLQAVDDVHNHYLGGFYTVSTDPATGLTTMTAVAGTNPSTMTEVQKNYHKALDKVVNGTGMTTINVVNNDNSVLIGDIVSGSVDIGDINQIGHGNYVNSGGALLHETYEQYEVQVLGTVFFKAHNRATRAEGGATGNIYNPERIISNMPSSSGIITVPVALGGGWHNVIIHYTNGNVTNVIR